MAFIFSFQGLVDLISIAPFYLAGIDARAVRALRLLRLLRVLKLQTHILETTVAQRTRELADKNAALEQAQAQLKAELDVARALQIAILPATFPAEARLRRRGAHDPGDHHGRGFLRLHRVAGRPGRAGDGRRLAAKACRRRSSWRWRAPTCATSRRDYPEPGACLAQTNDVLCAQNPMDLFVTVFYCVFDPATGMLVRERRPQSAFCAARRWFGRGPQRHGRTGARRDAGHRFPNHAMQLLPGDRLVLYTDGVTEAFNSADEAYGEDD